MQVSSFDTVAMHAQDLSCTLTLHQTLQHNLLPDTISILICMHACPLKFNSAASIRTHAAQHLYKCGAFNVKSIHLQGHLSAALRPSSALLEYGSSYCQQHTCVHINEGSPTPAKLA